MKKTILIPAAAAILLIPATHAFAQKKPAKTQNTSQNTTQQSSSANNSTTQTNQQTDNSNPDSSNMNWSEILKQYPNFFSAPADSSAQDSTSQSQKASSDTTVPNKAATPATTVNNKADSQSNTVLQNFLKMPADFSITVGQTPDQNSQVSVSAPAATTAPAKSKLALRSNYTSSSVDAYKTAPAAQTQKALTTISGFFSALQAQPQSSSYKYQTNTYSPETTKRLNSLAGLLGISGLGIVFMDRKNKKFNLTRNAFNV